MAFVVLKSTFARGSSLGNKLSKATSGFLLANSKHVVAPMQVATMKATHGEPYPYLKPWPYETKMFNTIHEYVNWERSLIRLNENSKMILVEGNVAVGKHEFAKQLAKEFDLKYIPSPTDDKCFMFRGLDLRLVNPMLPETARYYDLARFLADPHLEKGTAGRLQLLWYNQRFSAYATGLLHILSTGQGVVLVRSPFTDMVFTEALYGQGWLTRKFMQHYKLVYDNSIVELLKPHITLYLDAPVSVIQDRLRARNNPAEMESKNLTAGYLQGIRDAYEMKVLPKLRKSGEVIEIDCTEPLEVDDVEVVAEAIQELDLECWSVEQVKFKDWYDPNDDWAAQERKKYGDPYNIRAMLDVSEPWHCPEVMLSIDDQVALSDLYDTHPIFKYEAGWMPEIGDKTRFKLF